MKQRAIEVLRHAHDYVMGDHSRPLLDRLLAANVLHQYLCDLSFDIPASAVQQFLPDRPGYSEPEALKPRSRT